jgi:hypothetical protein
LKVDSPTEEQQKGFPIRISKNKISVPNRKPRIPKVKIFRKDVAETVGSKAEMQRKKLESEKFECYFDDLTDFGCIK